MALVARRRMTQSWREAVAEAAGADEVGRAALAAFDAALAGGAEEHVAAYEALAAAGRLVAVELPGDPASLAEAEADASARRPRDGRSAH